jgi:hypothetical protein
MEHNSILFFLFNDIQMFAFVLHIGSLKLVRNVFFFCVCLFVSYLDSFANILTSCFLSRIHVVIRWQSEPKYASNQ